MSNIFVSFLIVSVLKLVSPNENKEKNVKQQLLNYEQLKKNIQIIKEECGSLCNVDHSTYQPISEDSKFYYVPIQKDIDCNRLWNTSIFDESGNFKRPPQRIPKWLLDEFKHHSNLIDIKHHYYDELNHNIWNQTFNKWACRKRGLSTMSTR